VVVDNIATQVTTQGGSSTGQRLRNLVRRGAASGELVGVPAFKGGATPTLLEGFRLANGSPGRGQASDGLDIGITP
jgi:hypothetical protein